MSSLAGLLSVAGQAFYSASKFALESYSEALSIEVGQFNIKVSLIEPGFFKTNLHQTMSHVDNVLPTMRFYITQWRHQSSNLFYRETSPKRSLR
jgi:short-subunit dehydrogenase